MSRPDPEQLTMAREGKKVVLVEMDLRRPTMNALWGKSTAGLTAVLGGKAKLEEAVMTCQDSGNLGLLPAGQTLANPAELLNGPGMEEVLGSLRKRFEYVLVDSPPVLLTPDTLRVASLLDGVLFVVQAERTPRRLVDRALRQMERGSVKVLGLVLNRVPERSSAYGSYYGGAYRYSSKSGGAGTA